MILDDKLMKYVLFKKRTKNEVREKCKALNYEESYIEEVLEYLEENEYINDALYVQKYIANVMRIKKASVNEMKMDLLRRGIDSHLIEQCLEDSLNEFELQSAIQIVQKKAKTMEIEKLKRYLLNKGYSYDNIAKAIDNLQEIDDNGNEGGEA